MNDIYRDARERERDRRLVGLGLPCMCWVMVARCGGCRGKSPAIGLHIAWIIYDIVLTFVTALIYCIGSGDFMIILALLMFHFIWNLICLCLACKSGKKRGDFLILNCGNLCVSSFFHMFIMIIMSAPLVYIFIFSSAGLQILVLLELASYGLRIIVV